MIDDLTLLKNAEHALLARLDAIAMECGDTFPLYAPVNGSWKTSKNGSWIAGFWVGSWWLKARITGEQPDIAQRWCQKLNDKFAVDSIYRSFIFYYGATLGVEWFNDEKARQLNHQAVESLVQSYDSAMGCFPLGTELGGGERGKTTLNIDSLPSLIRLLHTHSQAEYLARQHTDTLIAHCLTDEGAWYSDAHFENGIFHSMGTAGAWSRGQAWGMLGLATAAQLWGEPYQKYAKRACDYWLETRLSAFPLNKLNEPEGLIDASATVIAALALFKMADVEPSYKNHAQRLTLEIINSPYFTEQGIFHGCCYATKPNTTELVETAWGSFLLLETITYCFQ